MTAPVGRTAGLGERLAGPAAASRVRFLDEGTTTTVGDLCAEGSGASRWISSLDRPVCAMVLSNTAACVAALFGAMGVGATVVSVPLPPRGSSPEWYAGFVESACRQTGAAGLLVDGEHRDLVPDGLSPDTRTYNEVLASTTRCSPAADGGFRLVQFTSGSTEQPRGVVLGERAVLANVDAILSVIDPEAYDTACSWLPLSHDMGLVGMLLAPCLATPTTSPGGNLCLLRPERFVRSPRTWLVACSEVRATCTAAPDFAFALMSRRATPAGLDLSSLRAAIVGAEPVRATTLTAFADRFAAAGFDDRAFCPAYGLAEAVLAVTMTAASERWRSVETDGRRLGDGVLAHVAGGTGATIVASGCAVPGTTVDAGRGRLGPVRFRASVPLEGYSDGTAPLDEDGWFTTGDLGFLEEDHLFVVGRGDDVIVVAGRNLLATDVEAALTGVDGLRAGRAIAVADPDGALAIVAEPSGDARTSPSARGRATAAARAAVTARTGVTPRHVVFVDPGRLPLTASGKVRRQAVAALLASGGFAE